MFSKLKKRYIAYLCVIGILFTVLCVQLYNLTIRDADQYASQTVSSNLKTLSVKGSRGSILDKNGVPLAYDISSYNVQFYKDPAAKLSSDRANYTQIIMKTIQIIEKEGGSVIDTFLIRRNDEGEFVYNLDNLDEKARAKRIENWRTNMQTGDSVVEPEEIYYELRTRYRIPEHVEYEEAIKILSIWQESQLMSYKSYIPVTIAYNVNFNTVSEIEAHQNELTGMQIASSTVRVYPKQSTAAHVIGYLGRMVDDDEIEEKQQQGYSPDDLVGKTGIEATMEQYLTGASTSRQGQVVLEVDSNGTVVGQNSYTAPKQGDNVVLTLDLGLQEVVEKELEANIKLIGEEQRRMYEEGREDTEHEKGYDTLLSERSKKEIDFNQSGAAIVMEVDTGNVLAMVSYPSYDLNLFTGGISEDVFNELLEDPATPLFNNAISSVSTPGSVFKMVTAVAGLMEGEISLDTIINDEGKFTKYINEGYTTAHAPACWTRYPQNHAHNQTVVEAIRDSCNYFFYTVADRLKIDRLNKWADNFGLTSSTGIELTGEAVGWVGNQKILYDNTKPIDQQKTYKPQLVYNKVREQLEKYGEERSTTYTDEMLDTAATQIVELAGEGNWEAGGAIREILSKELDIPQNVSRDRGWSAELFNIIRELMWTDTDTVTQGIGVTPTQLTPIAIARYICALMNGGKVMEAHIVDKIVDYEGNVVKDVEPVIVNDLQLPDQYTEAIKRGMEKVVSGEGEIGGTASGAFVNFKYKDQIVGKTGTAPVSTIDLEDNVWLCLAAPKDDPEIAIVIFLPHGLSESKAYPAAKAILQYYFESKEEQEKPSDSNTPEEGGLVDDIPKETASTQPTDTITPAE